LVSTSCTQLPSTLSCLSAPSYVARRHLHSFPTRRSSDLPPWRSSSTSPRQCCRPSADGDHFLRPTLRTNFIQSWLFSCRPAPRMGLMNATKHLLAGDRVADVSRVLAGPYTTALPAHQGAEVIKIEMPGHGDDSRHLGPFTDSGSTYFTGLNRGKRSIEADLKDPEHHARLLELIADCDVVVENFRPGVAAKLGLSYEDLVAVKSDIVYASISGFGQAGAQAKRP